MTDSKKLRAQGRDVDHSETMRDLGDPRTWAAHERLVRMEFNSKPRKEVESELREWTKSLPVGIRQVISTSRISDKELLKLDKRGVEIATGLKGADAEKVRAQLAKSDESSGRPSRRRKKRA